MKKINLQDILKIETLGDDARVVLLHMKSRTWRLSLPKDALQFAMAIQRNMKVGPGIAERTGKGRVWDGVRVTGRVGVVAADLLEPRTQRGSDHSFCHH